MSTAPATIAGSNRNSRLGRILVIASHAFTQLVRMKVFYFLAVFAVIAIGSNFIDLPQHVTPESAGINVLHSIKSWSLGTMHLFSVVLAIIATALLIPKDVEDRTLYTILAKPVPRLDYLAGKLLGVILLVVVSLVLMDVLMTAVLHVRTSMILAQQMGVAQTRNWSAAETASLRAAILTHGPTMSLQGAVIAVALRASVIASLALFVSTFSTSTLFTSIVSFMVYFIGHFQADARGTFLDAGGGILARSASMLITLIIPDFQPFNVIDAVIEGQVMPLAVMGELAGLSAFHVLFYLFASWFVFADKEF